MSGPDFAPPGYLTIALFAKVPPDALEAWREEAHDDDYEEQLVDDFETVAGTGDYSALVTYAPQSTDYMDEASDLAKELSRTADGIVYAAFFGELGGSSFVTGFREGTRVVDEGPDAKPYALAKELGLGHLIPAD